ncbi:hypothetical protein MYCTH_92395 [Thermothelomyces thermophilus ATCC 42464]|uniref:Uncharacterized protein n=1 Tax=Thermothelomyces thermophilus (strain ATCC 42464 / BCRC 31852 / DSM 1799) TaxID=573729 RepID=G2Q810_THET4|nr:uncharacterized protein MYCTH_92395 [Thermothelomyces thermophilus ATCC 42464]AEO56967.1 hypothetical protein MYCTH_92395 [Thermothelomyces thermophilus ATCC 42464]
MTEPESFDDELFADLYNDDEPSSKPPRDSETDQNTAAQPASETKNDHAEAAGQEQSHNGDAKDEEEEEDDEDDIDFNLGNGPSTTLTHHDNNNHNEHRDQKDDHGVKPTHSGPPAPVSHSKGPNAKEDG